MKDAMMVLTMIMIGMWNLMMWVLMEKQILWILVKGMVFRPPALVQIYRESHILIKQISMNRT